MVFRRARLCSDSGVVEAKYEMKDVSLRLEAYDDAISCNVQTVKCEWKSSNLYAPFARQSLDTVSSRR